MLPRYPAFAGLAVRSLTRRRNPRGAGEKTNARRMWALTYDFLSFMSDSFQRAVFTQTVDPGFKAKGDRYVARLRKASREYEIAIRAGIKRSHLKVPKRLLLETSL